MLAAKIVGQCEERGEHGRRAHTLAHNAPNNNDVTRLADFFVFFLCARVSRRARSSGCLRKESPLNFSAMMEEEDMTQRSSEQFYHSASAL